VPVQFKSWLGGLSKEAGSFQVLCLDSSGRLLSIVLLHVGPGIRMDGYSNFHLWTLRAGVQFILRQDGLLSHM
jgi:hypothetical protein